MTSQEHGKSTDDQKRTRPKHHEPVATSAQFPTFPKLLIPNLPTKHYPYWLKNNPFTYSQFLELCNQVDPDKIDNPQYFQELHVNFTFEDETYIKNPNYGKRILGSICSNIKEVTKFCWGYENNCQNIYLMPECHGSSLGQAKTKQEHKILWFNQADFGFVLERRREMNRYCIANKQSTELIKSSFDCTKNFKTCRGDHLMINVKSILNQFESLTQPKSLHELIRPGDIGGWNCDLQAKRIPEEAGQEGELQSWYNELKNYQLLTNQTPDKACEVIVDKQVYFVKPDSMTNLYHHMTTILNLYITMHVNNRFFDDNQIILWDSKPLINSKFDLMWNSFSRNKPITLADLKGKRVCFQKFIFALPPRMLNGLYYNSQLVSGCTKTGLFDAFNKHITHKLNIPQFYFPEFHLKSNNTVVRIIILRRSTPGRQIQNEQALKDALLTRQVKVEIMDYAELDFQKTLAITLNADILIGIHGAGLTNMLFLPDWASVIELYNCGDRAYFDLARLRGVGYSTLDDKFVNKIELIEDLKMANYTIDVDGFLQVAEKSIEKMKLNRAKHFEKLGYKLGSVDNNSRPSAHEEL